jgi:hypothetical protein
MTHALLGLRAEIVNDDADQPQSISITEPQDDRLVNLTLIFDLQSGLLVEAKAIAPIAEEAPISATE